ncbi:MAG: SDR family oxidoreductase [Phycisphaerae bacterium]|nr:SDR family oxidoreductase [Phycisphaerae bacterium]
MSDRAKVVLITGSARRVGRSIALELARAGWDVAVHCRTSLDDAKRTAGDVESLGRRAIVLQADLADAATPERLVGETVDRLGGLNALINNASLWEATPLSGLTRQAWNAHLETNLTAPAMLAQAAWEHLRRSPPGFLINICDISGDRPWADYIAYCASKGGLISLTKALARAMAPDVCVNGISPGVVLLPDDASDATRRAALRRVPLQREGSAHDIAKTVRFLVEDGHYVTGQILNVDGGRSLA